MPDELTTPQGKTLFNIRPEDFKRVIQTNYGLIVIEGIFGLLLVYYFLAVPLWLALQAILTTLIGNIILHLFVLLKASRIIQEIVLFIMGTAIVLSLTLFIHYYPEARSAFLLAYLPSIIFTGSMSLSYGIVNLTEVIASFGIMTWIEYSGIQFLAKPFNIAAEPTSWKVGTVFSLFFIILIGIMTTYFSTILRKRNLENAKLAFENKKLYQQSKTTSDEIVKNMREGMIVLDDHFRIIQVNQALSGMIKEKKDLTNFPIHSLPLFFAPKLVIYLDDIKKNDTKNFSFKAQDELKNIYDINIAKIELRKNDPGYIVMITQNPLPWGVVYDARSDKAVDLALVRLHDVDEKIIETRATDRDGRFGFIVSEGEYSITVSKEGYSFPSKADGGYIGEKIKVESTADSFLNLKIPMDKTTSEPNKVEKEEANAEETASKPIDK